MDEKFDTYEELRSYLSDLPLTWYPDLITAMVEAAYKKKVFNPGMASKWVRQLCEPEEYRADIEAKALAASQKASDDA